MENSYRKSRHENPEIYKDWKTILAQEEGELVIDDEVKKGGIANELDEAAQKKLTEIEALKPTWIEGEEAAEAIWQDFVSEFLDTELKAGEGDPAIAAEYYDQYYKMILGDLAERYLPKTQINAEDGFGDGFWEAEYYSGAEISRLPAAQYLSPRNILEGGMNDEAWQATYSQAVRSTHFNLCGQLAVMEGLGLGLTEGLRIFYEEVDNRKQEGNTILGNPSRGTFASDLISFIVAIAKSRNETWEVEHFYLANQDYRSAFLDAQLSKQNLLIVLVNIDPRREGELNHGEAGKCPHWVVLQDLFDLAGKLFVRLYNPFMNREEVYLWERFEEAWEMAEVNSAPRGIFGRRLNR